MLVTQSVELFFVRDALFVWKSNQIYMPNITRESEWSYKDMLPLFYKRLIWIWFRWKKVCHLRQTMLNHVFEWKIAKGKILVLSGTKKTFGIWNRMVHSKIFIRYEEYRRSVKITIFGGLVIVFRHDSFFSGSRCDTSSLTLQGPKRLMTWYLLTFWPTLS